MIFLSFSVCLVVDVRVYLCIVYGVWPLCSVVDFVLFAVGIGLLGLVTMTYSGV